MAGLQASDSKVKSPYKWRKETCYTCAEREDCSQMTEDGKIVKVCDGWHPDGTERWDLIFEKAEEVARKEGAY